MSEHTPHGCEDAVFLPSCFDCGEPVHWDDDEQRWIHDDLHLEPGGEE